MLVVVLAGGVGERFWPKSRRDRPKQFLDLTGRGSMIALTADRMRRVSSAGEIFVVTVAPHAEGVVRELAGRVPPANVVVEPVGRNTAASIGLAAVLLETRFGDEPFAVVPADHVIGDEDAFVADMRAAEAYVRTHDCLLTFGIRPRRPETGYGYIQSGRRVGEVGGAAVFEVERFHEKPSEENAKAFLEAGAYFWNSGMFVWRPSTILRAIRAHMPDLARVLERVAEGSGTERFEDVLKSSYETLPPISIDYGVMERAGNVVVLEARFRWSDVGSWESVRELFGADERENVLVGEHVVVDG